MQAPGMEAAMWSTLKSIDWSRGAVLSRVLGAFSLVLGATCAIESYRLWTGWAGSGVLPGAVAIVFIVLAIGFAAFPGPATEIVKPMDRRELRSVAVLVAAFAVYLAILPRLGFLMSTWAFLFTSGRLAAGSSATSAFLWAGTLALGSHFLFRVALGTAFPVGPWGF